MKYVIAAARNNKLDLFKIREIKAHQINKIFEELPNVIIKGENGEKSILKFSNNRQNKYRLYLHRLFESLQKN